MARLPSHFYCLLLTLIVICVFSSAIAQNPPGQTPTSDTGQKTRSLADIARNSKAQKAVHAKKVLTDEDMEATAGPLPRLKMDGAENADDIVAAISAYKSKHTPEETERAVRIWYERYDEMLAAAIQDNLDLKTLRDTNFANGNELCQESQDYQQCQNRRMAEMRGARHDQTEMAQNGALTVRIQHSFMKVRNGLQMNGLRYEWFKIRTTNNIDNY